MIIMVSETVLGGGGVIIIYIYIYFFFFFIYFFFFSINKNYVSVVEIDLGVTVYEPDVYITGRGCAH